jgi:two-component sensor histidine kinase
VTVFSPDLASGGVLLRELQQRVGNGLTAAVNIISAAAVRAETAETKAALSDVVDLLHGQADLHRALIVPEGQTLIDAASYIRKFGAALRRSMLDQMNIRLAFATESIPLEAERCWCAGLIVHDLIASAARNACFDGRAGEIKVKLSRIGALVNCVVLDNGSSSTCASAVRELRISNDLAKGLLGRVEIGFGAEFTSVVLSFRMTEREQQANWTMAVRRMRSQRRSRRSPSVVVAREGTIASDHAECAAASRPTPDLTQAQPAHDPAVSSH